VRKTAAAAENVMSEAGNRMQESASRAVDRLRDCQLKVLSATQASVNAFFEYAQDVVRAKSIPELVELSTAHTRRQYELMSEQSREMAEATQELAKEAARPLTSDLGIQIRQMS
jgi:phasin family protein